MERLRGLQAKDTLKQSIKANDPQCCHRNCDGNNGYCRQSSADAAVTGCSACAQELADQLSSRSRLSSAALPSYSPLLSERQQRQHLLPGWKFMLFGHTFCATTPNNHCCQDDELLCYCFLNLFVKCVKYILFVGHTYTYYIGQQDEHY